MKNKIQFLESLYISFFVSAIVLFGYLIFFSKNLDGWNNKYYRSLLIVVLVLGVISFAGKFFLNRKLSKELKNEEEVLNSIGKKEEL